jgi:hypothetical protein
MVIPTSYKAPSSRNDILEGTPVDADLHNASIEGNSRTGLLDVIVLPETQRRSCDVRNRRRINPVIQKAVCVRRKD